MPALLLGMVFGACGGKATDTDGPVKADGVSGTTTGDFAGSGGAYSTPGSPARGGQPSMPSPGVAGVGGRVPGRPIDLPPCGFDNECGGCTLEYVSVVCSWGNVELPWDVAEHLSGNPPAVCRAAQQQYAETQGGAGAGAGGEAGAGGAVPVFPGACATYKAPGRYITSCEYGCTETADIQKRGQCTIGGECCVLVGSTWCGI